MADLLRLNRRLGATPARSGDVEATSTTKGRAARARSRPRRFETARPAAAAVASGRRPADAGTRRPERCAWSIGDLLDLHGGAGSLELRLDLGRLVLGDRLLDRLRRRLDQVLGLLQAQAGDRADLLDDVDLLGAERRSGSRRTRSAPRPPRPQPQHAPPPAAATATGAAAETPHFSSSIFDSCAASRTVRLERSSTS